MSRLIQLEPQIMPGADAFDATPGDPEEEERRRRELASLVLGETPSGAVQNEGDAVGARYRAAGGQPAPSSVRHDTNRGHAGTSSVLRFDQPPPPAESSPIPAPGATAPSPRLASLILGGGRTEADARVPGAREYAASMPREQAAPRLAGRTRPPEGGKPSRYTSEQLRELAGKRIAPESRVDHTGADVADAVRRPLHALGAALSAASGRSTRPMRSYGAESRQREAQQAEQKQAAGEALSRERLGAQRLEMQAEEAEARRSDRQAQADSMDAYRQRMADIRQQLADGTITRQRAAAELARERSRREAAHSDPQSPESERARLRFQREIDLMPEPLRRMVPDVDISEMSAADVERLEPRLGAYGQLRHTPGRHGGGGGGNSLRRNAPEWWSGSQEEWRALGATGQRQEIQRHARGGGEEGGGTEILPGVVSPMDLPASEVQAMRNGIAEAGSSASNIRELGAIHERFGGLSSRISREAQAEIVPRLTIASGMVATLGNTGTINESEVPRINAALPNPGDLEQMTFGTFQARMRTWQNLLESRVRAQLAARGVDDEGIRMVMQTIRTGSFAAGGSGGRQQGSDMVNVTRPDGTTGQIPRRLVDRARQRGWTVNDGS